MAAESVSPEKIKKEAFVKLLCDFVRAPTPLSQICMALDQNPNPKLLDLKIKLKKNVMVAESLLGELGKLQQLEKLMRETFPVADVQLENMRQAEIDSNRKSQIALVTPFYFHRSQAFVFAYKVLSVAIADIDSPLDYFFDDKSKLWLERLSTGMYEQGKMSCEEQTIRILFVKALLRKISFEQVGTVITYAFHVIKYGYLNENCSTKQYDEYESEVIDFTKSLDEVNKQIA
jgi:hypothetical protein